MEKQNDKGLSIDDQVELHAKMYRMIDELVHLAYWHGAYDAMHDLKSGYEGCDERRCDLLSTPVDKLLDIVIQNNHVVAMKKGNLKRKVGMLISGSYDMIINGEK